jgi:hypothetical protein
MSEYTSWLMLAKAFIEMIMDVKLNQGRAVSGKKYQVHLQKEVAKARMPPHVNLKTGKALSRLTRST